MLLALDPYGHVMILPYQLFGQYQPFQWDTCLAEIDRGQLLMLAGFVMLGWVLARRTIRRRKAMFREGRQADRDYERLRNPPNHAVPLCDAPVEAQRWQVAMFDLQRELKADLDTRIAVVQTLLRQVDDRIDTLQTMSGMDHSRPIARQSPAEADVHGDSAGDCGAGASTSLSVESRPSGPSGGTS